MKPLLTTFRTALLVALAAIALLGSPFNKYSHSSDAQACWSYLRIECFNGAVTSWPWCQPQGQGRCWATNPPPNGPLTWGLQDRYYSVLYNGSLCEQSDDQALWVIGEPGSEDPEFDNYPANLTTIVTYGPLNLTNAQIAQVQFSLYFLNALDPQDTIVWGADSVAAIATTHMWVDTTIATPTENGWTTFTVNLADLHRNIATRDSVSALGRPAVYIYWWFKSDGDAMRARGAFLDDVIVVTDNGSVDMIAGGLELRDPNGINTPSRVEVGDYIRSYVTWSTCNGGVASYPDFHARMYLDGGVLFDSLMHGVQPGSTFTWLSDSFMVESEGEHLLQFQIDPLSEVVEVDENNNVVSYPFTVYAINVPPTFTWLTPSTDTLRTVNDQAILRWQLFDPDDEAICSIHIDTDTFGCVGPIVPGTANRGETPGADSVIWSTITIPDNQVRWLYAEYGDALFLGCSYAPYPVLVMPLANGEHVFVPVAFSLNQNYPNPFNPETDIHFSITTGGHTTLKVFDITGREIATLIDNDLTPGAYDTHFNAGINRPSGVYLYRLDAPEGSITKKMILMK